MNGNCNSNVNDNSNGNGTGTKELLYFHTLNRFINFTLKNPKIV